MSSACNSRPLSPSLPPCSHNSPLTLTSSVAPPSATTTTGPPASSTPPPSILSPSSRPETNVAGRSPEQALFRTHTNNTYARYEPVQEHPLRRWADGEGC